MSVCVEYVEGGILFNGFFLDWNASPEAIRTVANLIAPGVRCETRTIERILHFELSLGTLIPALG